MITVTSFASRTVAVFGLARSGIVAAEALRAGGATVACWDDGQSGRDAAAKAGLPLVDLSTVDWSGFAALVLAPGVPLTHPAPHWTVDKARAAGVPVIGDIELFFRERAAVAPGSPVVAITGTNGKSTTTALIAHVLRHAGHKVEMGGNIGVGVLSLPPPAPGTVHVLELSSFQIDLTPSLAPTIGILTNITPDHLDRHGTLANYAAVKERVVASADIAICGTGDALTRAAAARRLATGGRTIACLVADDDTRPSVSATAPELAGMIAKGLDLVTAHTAGPIERGAMHLADLASAPALRGPHNAENAAIAAAAAAALGLGTEAIQAGLVSFPGLAHRMEILGRIGKVVVVNDSKATNADSTEKALASYDRDIYWIAGGTPKEGGITPLARYFPRVTRAYLIGKCAPDFAATLDGKVPHEISATLDVALAHALRDATASASAAPVVLLSPACASYDQYKSFEHRGDHFRALFAEAAAPHAAPPASAADEQRISPPPRGEGLGVGGIAAVGQNTSAPTTGRPGEGTSPQIPQTSKSKTMTTSASRNIMLSAGGTGGHLFPALALAQELARRSMTVDLITDMRGDRYGADFPARKVYQVPSATLKGRNPLALARTGLTLARGVASARSILRSVRPQAIIGFGGYPTIPPMIAATLMRIPSAIHEQNAVLGRANKMLANRVDAIATSFDGVIGLEQLTAKARFTGNPVRDNVVAASHQPYVAPEVGGPYKILVFGGSQGARFFSDAVPAALASFGREVAANLHVVQQARDEDLARVTEAYRDAGISAEVAPFFSDLPARIAASHLVIGRAGASTTAELTVIGRPSILVPLPHALDNDQLNNARRLQAAGAALLAEQAKLTSGLLATEISRLLEQPGRLASMALSAKRIGRPDAVSRLADLVEELMSPSRRMQGEA